MAVPRPPDIQGFDHGYTPGASFPLTLSFTDAAEYLGISKAALEGVLEHGSLRPAGGSGSGQPAFTVDALDTFLDEQHARAVITGKLTMPLKASIDVPGLLSRMVAMRDEAEAATALATEVRGLAGSRCPAVAILRSDEVMECVRLLAITGFDGSQAFPAFNDAESLLPEADFHHLQTPLRTAIVDNRPLDSDRVHDVLLPVLGDETARFTAHLNLHGTIVYPLLRVSTVRWSIVVLLEGDPLEIRPETRDAIEALGIQASVALEAVRLRGDVMHRANRAEALYGTVRMLARSEDSATLLERISSLAARLLSADAAVVLIHDADTDAFHPAGETGLDSSSDTWTANLSATYLVGRAAGMTTPLQVTDASNTDSLSMPRLAGNRRALAAICAPIIYKGVILGAIEAYSARPRSFSEDDMSLLSAFAHQAAIAIDSVQTQEKRRRALFGAVEALASANEARDGYTGEHCKRLADLAVMIARQLGFSDDEVERIGLGAALHDIGKIAVPDAILRKPGPLTEDERQIINLHPSTGEEIVARVPELQDVAAMIGAHQERWDGGGYPRGIAGADIPIGARIIAVVDTYAALIEDRPYRRGASHEEALAELVKCSGTQFDPQVVDAFVAMGETIQALVDIRSDAQHDGASSLQVRGYAAAQPAGAVVSGTTLLPGQRPGLHRARELSALNDLIRAVASTRNLRVMYDLLYHKLSDILDVDAILVLLADGTRADSRSVPTLYHAPWFPAIGHPVENGVVTPVARLKRPLWVNDYIAYTAERDIESPLAQSSNVPRSMITVPMIVDDEFLGVLSVQALHAEAYDKRHVGILEDVALHVALAIRNTRERPDTDVATSADVNGLSVLIDRLQTLATDDEVATATVEAARAIVPGERHLLYLIRHDEPVVAAIDGCFTDAEQDAYRSMVVPRGSGLVWAAIDSGRSACISALAADAHAHFLAHTPAPDESALVIPLLHEGEVVAVLLITRKSSPFAEEDEQALASTTAAAAAALGALKMRSREAERVRGLTTLRRAVELVSSRADRDAALTAIVESLGAVFGYRVVSLYLRKRTALTLHTHIGYDNAPQHHTLDDPIVSRVILGGDSVLIEDVAQEPSSGQFQAGIVSVVAVPVSIRGDIVGVLMVASGRERKLQQWDLALIELFSLQAGTALSSSQHSDERPGTSQLDPMTSLPNQAALVHHLARAMEESRQKADPLSLLFLDLDHFKMANDAFGHRFGDELLSWLGEFLPRALPPTAYVARYGGEEFVVVLQRTPTENAEWIAEKLRAEMAERAFETSLGHFVQLSVSIGVAGFDLDGHFHQTPEDLLHAADRAMYAAKLRGRNRVVRWSPDVVRFVQTR